MQEVNSIDDLYKCKRCGCFIAKWAYQIHEKECVTENEEDKDE